MSQETTSYNDDKTVLLSASGFTHFQFLSITKEVYGYDSSIYAFKESKATLTSFSFDEDSQLEKILNHAFYQCSRLTAADFSNCSKLCSIGAHAFFQCSGIKSVIFPVTSSFKTIGANSFYGTIIKEIFFPASVNSLGGRAFQYCNSLTNITFHPDTLINSLGGSSFFGTPIKEFTIPASVTSFDGAIFEGCAFLNNVYVAERQTKYISIDGVIYDSSKTYVAYFPGGRKGNYDLLPNVTVFRGSSFTYSHISSLRFPPTLEAIYGWAFCSSKITTLSFPLSLRRIDGYAFYNCKNLINVTITEGVTDIGASCFLYCSQLKEIILPSTLKNLGGAAFSNCANGIIIRFDSNSEYYLDYQYLIMNKANTSISQYIGTGSSVVIPNSVTTIKSQAFYEKSFLKSVTFSGISSLATIDSSAFLGCSSLETFELPLTVRTVKASAFYNCQKLKTITFGRSLSLIEEKAFQHCKSLLSIVFTSEIMYKIGDYSFSKCSSLSSITFADGLEGLGFNCFEYCSALESIEIPSKVVYLKDYCFSYTGLIECKINSTVITTISSFLFYNSTSFEDFLIPQSITTICIYSFFNTKIKEIILPDNVCTLERFCFSDCDRVTKLVIPKLSKLTTIEFGAFMGCSSLAFIENNCASFVKDNEALFNKDKTKLIIMPPKSSIYYFAFPSSVTTIGESALSGCKNLQIVFIPDNSISDIETSAFEGCSNLRSINIPKCVKRVGLNAFKSCKKLQNGLSIDNREPTFLQSLVEYSLLPSRCLQPSIYQCTCKHNQRKAIHFISAFIFISPTH